MLENKHELKPTFIFAQTKLLSASLLSMSAGTTCRQSGTARVREASTRQTDWNV